MSVNNINSEEIAMDNCNETNGSKGTHRLLASFNRKRRHGFDVDLKVERVLSLPYASGKFFFKIRLLNGGHHVYVCHQRFEIHDNQVEFHKSDRFSVKMTSRVDNFTLDHCFCRISIRREGRGGRSFEKIGYYDLDLASVAGSGDESKACLLNAYQQTNTRPANAYLEIRMKLTIMEGDHIFRRPSSNNPYIKIDNLPFNNDSDAFPDECSSIASQTPGELYPPSGGNVHRGHSRQPSKSSVSSNHSTVSNNSINNSSHHDKNPIRNLINGSHHFHSCHSDPNMISSHTRQASDDEISNQSHKRFINSRRTPFIDQFGDIQRRLHTTRVDAHQIVNDVINETAKTVTNSNGYLCLMFNEDGTAHVGSSSCQSLQSHPSSVFLST